MHTTATHIAPHPAGRCTIRYTQTRDGYETVRTAHIIGPFGEVTLQRVHVDGPSIMFPPAGMILVHTPNPDTPDRPDVSVTYVGADPWLHLLADNHANTEGLDQDAADGLTRLYGTYLPS